MLTSTMLIALQIRYVKQLPIVIGLAFFVPFGFFDDTSFVILCFRHVDFAFSDFVAQYRPLLGCIAQEGTRRCLGALDDRFNPVRSLRPSFQGLTLLPST
jgi:hypothetical protein